MRACRSYLSLMARSTLYKELALFVVMAVVELALFIPNLEKQFSEVVGIGENGEEIYSMYSLPVDEIAENTHLQWVWIAALVPAHAFGIWQYTASSAYAPCRFQGDDSS